MINSLRRYNDRHFRHVRTGRCKRYASERLDDYGLGARVRWHTRVEDREILRFWNDDYPRARRGVGWKNHRCRRQWEHNAIERAAHENNRRREWMRGERCLSR